MFMWTKVKHHKLQNKAIIKWVGDKRRFIKTLHAPFTVFALPQPNTIF